MKAGMEINELAEELTRQNDVKKDYIADTRKLHLHEDGTLDLGDSSLKTSDNFHAQLAYRLGIPKGYYDRMRVDQPDLLTHNVNTWFQKEPNNRMVRTLDGTARAFLSERYRPLDNFDLANATIPVLTELGAEIKSADITENKFYLKAILPGQEEIIAPPGIDPTGLKFDGSQADKHIFVDFVQPGIIISNSETGCGGVNVWPGIHTRRCTNLATFRADGFSKTHIGGALSKLLREGEDLGQYIQNDTRRASDEAMWKTIRDFCRASLEGDVFKTLVERLRETRGAKIEGDIPKVLEVTGRQFGLSDKEQGGILKHLIEGGELTQYGLSNAVTQYSQNGEVDYDRASELEQVGAGIVELPKNDWNQIAVAA